VTKSRGARESEFLTGAPTEAGAPEARPAPSASDVLLRVLDLKTYFYTYDGVVKALDGVTFTIRRGETIGLVGETGCGKSVTAFSITRLVADPPGRIVGGKVLFNKANLLWNVEREAKIKPIKGTVRAKVSRRYRRIRDAQNRLTSLRGSQISMIFQEPMAALNPVFSISNQIGETLQLHRMEAICRRLLEASPPPIRLSDTAPIILKAAQEPGQPNLEKVARSLADRTFRPGLEAKLLELFRGHEADAGAQLPALERYLRQEGSPRGVELKKAAASLLEAAGEPAQPRLRAVCHDLAAQVGVPSLETELFYLFKGRTQDPQKMLPGVARAIRRVTLTPSQRSYLVYREKLARYQADVRKLYLREMEQGRSTRNGRRKLALRFLGTSARSWGLRLPFYRGHNRRPLDQEIFWQTVRLLEGVGIANPVQVARGYPHELSGGMIQRVMIAMALAPEPALLIADEPTTALDVTIQAQILELMRDLKARIGTSILLITHDLGVVAEVCDRVCVMYAGNIVEVAPVKDLYSRPLHPYSQGLLASIPRMDDPNKKLESIPGSVPNLIRPPSGCRFHPRCAHAMEVCKVKRPPMTQEGPDHVVACWLYSGPEVKDY
jgi:oligopeptide/dipeptide ABC transporter ATP-binding protein